MVVKLFAAVMIGDVAPAFGLYGVVLETEAQVAAHAREIYLQSGLTHAMPPANVSYMEPEERAAIIRWFRVASNG